MPHSTESTLPAVAGRRRRPRGAAGPGLRTRRRLLDAGDGRVRGPQGYHAARVDDIVKEADDLPRHLLPVLRQQGGAVPRAGGETSPPSSSAWRRRSAMDAGPEGCARAARVAGALRRALRPAQPGDPGLDRDRDGRPRARPPRHRRAGRVHAVLVDRIRVRRRTTSIRSSRRSRSSP